VKKKALILIAEENDSDFALLEKNLQRFEHPFDIFRFRDGQNLLSTLRKLGEKDTVYSRPYLLFLDIQLPPEGGMAILETLKSDPQLKKIPVILLLTSESEQVLEKCYQRGCGFCLRKPEDSERFSEVIRRVSDFLSVVELPELAVLDIAGTDL
jgi:CheY-like chemotaxis protein